MSNLLRRLRAAWFYSRNFPVFDLPHGYWTAVDARILSTFLTSETGTKVRHIWAQNVHQSAQRAIMESGEHASYKAGVAFGIRSQIADTDSLLIISPEVSESLQTTDTDEGQFRSLNK